MMDFVRESGSVDGRKLGEMMLSSETAAENYRALGKCFRGWQVECLNTMAREAMAQRACLSGIRALVTGEEGGRNHPVPPDTGTLNVRLKKAYVRAMRLLSACEAHTRDPESGPVFQRLSHRQQEHCRRILEIIGSL